MTRIAIKSLSVGVATLVVGAAGLSLAFAQTPSDMEMTQAQCDTLWSQALAGSSGDLSMDLAKPYVSDFNKADKNGDQKLSQAEWADACTQGLVQSSSEGAGEGASGSSDKTSDRTPGDPSPSRTPGATGSGAAGTDAGMTPSGTSDRTPDKQ